MTTSEQRFNQFVSELDQLCLKHNVDIATECLQVWEEYSGDLPWIENCIMETPLE